MTDKIILKIDFFLKKHAPFQEESEVVYLLVELRKLLDKERSRGADNKDSLVRFYADWIVHTSKDYITPTMTIIMERIDIILTPYPKNGNLRFLLAPELKLELSALFKKHHFPTNIVEDDQEWKNFVWLLTQILSDQPLINPTPTISEFYFSEVGKGYIGATINFNDKRGSITLGGDIDML